MSESGIVDRIVMCMKYIRVAIVGMYSYNK